MIIVETAPRFSTVRTILEDAATLSVNGYVITKANILPDRLPSP